MRLHVHQARGARPDAATHIVDRYRLAAAGHDRPATSQPDHLQHGGAEVDVVPRLQHHLPGSVHDIGNRRNPRAIASGEHRGHADADTCRSAGRYTAALGPAARCHPIAGRTA